jgi:hypothetical protein
MNAHTPTRTPTGMRSWDKAEDSSKSLKSLVADAVECEPGSLLFALNRVISCKNRVTYSDDRDLRLRRSAFCDFSEGAYQGINRDAALRNTIEKGQKHSLF